MMTRIVCWKNNIRGASTPVTYRHDEAFQRTGTTLDPWMLSCPDFFVHTAGIVQFIMFETPTPPLLIMMAK